MTEIPFGLGAVLFVGGYLVLLLGLGCLAKRRRTSNSLSEFYLAGRNFGGFVLFLTLYATQYSGNSLLGYPGEAYRLGFAWLALVALVPRITLWGLTELEMEILPQLSPLFLLGLTWRRFAAGPALVGIVVGIGLSMGLTLSGHGRVWGIHAGILGAGVNYLVCVAATFLRPTSSTPAPQSHISSIVSSA